MQYTEVCDIRHTGITWRYGACNILRCETAGIYVKISTLPIPLQYICTEVCDIRHTCVTQHHGTYDILRCVRAGVYVEISTFSLPLQYI